MNAMSISRAAGLFLGRVGTQLVVSLATSATIAAFFAGPGLLSGQAAVDRGSVASESWVLPFAADGKIRDRLTMDTPAPALAPGLASPAAVLMPMALSFAAEPSEPKAEPALVHVAELAPNVARSVPLPPRRPQALARASEPAPLMIAPPAQLAAVSIDADPDGDAPRPPATILGRPVPVPVGKLTAAVSGAANMVGAAGSWTVARATSLVAGL